MEKMIYGPLELPSGRKIKFRESVGQDKVSVVNAAKVSADDVVSAAFLIDGYVAVKCIVDIDGQMPSGTYKQVYADMTEDDIEFYAVVFREMFGMNNEKKARAKEAAKNLRCGLTSTVISSSPSTEKQ